MVDDEQEELPAWALRPVEAPDSAFKRAVSVFVHGVAGGAVTVVTFGLVLPSMVEVRGATRSLQVDREVRARCLELGVTPAQLAELDARAGDP